MAFINRNFCKTFQSNINSSNFVQLSSSQECSEVIVSIYSSSNPATEYVEIIDPNNPTVPFRIIANKDFTFRGLTNSNQLSAKSSKATDVLYYRTQYFGSMTDL
jgi:hypothetical protein